MRVDFRAAGKRRATDLARQGSSIPAPAQAPQRDRPSAPVDAGAFGPTPTVGPQALEALAQDAQRETLALARTASASTRPLEREALHAQLQARFSSWQRSVAALVEVGQLSSPAVKGFARHLEQACLVQANLSAAAHGLQGAAYARAVRPIIAAICVTAPGDTVESVIAANPLLLVPPLAEGPGLASAKARGIPTVRATVNETTAEVRQDLVLVFCPGVARTGDEFVAQRAAALRAGLGSVRAETGSFHSAQLNAEQIAAAVKQAKALVNNPKAKVVLVGYSQGNTNLFEFMRDESGSYSALREDVRAIHCMHNAAGGSQLADLAYALGDELTKDRHLTPQDRDLLRAYYRAKAQMLGLPTGAARFNERFIGVLATVLAGARWVLTPVRRLLHALGISRRLAPFREHLLQQLERHQDWPMILQKIGPSGVKLAGRLEPLWQQMTYGYERAVLLNPEVFSLYQVYVRGGLRSLTTQYGKQLLSDPQLAEHLSRVPVLNSIGEVPAARMMPVTLSGAVPCQRLGYRFFQQLGLASDYQVSSQSQALGRYLPTAVDLPPEAIGHWGVAGMVVNHDHPASFFKDFKPEGLTQAALTTFAAMGVL